MFNNELRAKFDKNKIMAVVVIENINDALPAAESLLEGGIKIIELALRTEASLDALIKIKESLPELTVGAGTVITPAQVQKLVENEVQFGVSPGTNEEVMTAVKKFGLSFAPGISTASDIEKAVSYGFKTLKFFPAEPLGSVKYLKSLSGPYKHLGLEFIPLGGVKENNFDKYLECDNVLAVGGSWMLKNNLISDKKWKQITANAKTCMDLVKQIPAKTQRQSQVDTLSIKKVNKIREMIQQQHKEDKDLANKE